MIDSHLSRIGIPERRNAEVGIPQYRRKISGKEGFSDENGSGDSYMGPDWNELERKGEQKWKRKDGF